MRHSWHVHFIQVSHKCGFDSSSTNRRHYLWRVSSILTSVLQWSAPHYLPRITLDIKTVCLCWWWHWIINQWQSKTENSKTKILVMSHTPFILCKEKETTDWRFEGFCRGNGAKNHAVQHNSPWFCKSSCFWVVSFCYGSTFIPCFKAEKPFSSTIPLTGSRNVFCGLDWGIERGKTKNSYFIPHLHKNKKLLLMWFQFTHWVSS